jgi:hypothetical protein
MNIGYAVAALGVLGVIVGGGMYAAGWHHTIGLGGIGLGIVLIIAGIWLARNPPAKATTQPSQPKQ